MSVEARVSRLEQVMIELAQSQKRLHEELLEFKEEMREFKQEMLEFKDEMKVFKDEMRDFKDEMNKKWGWVINKLGTLVEDLFYPSFDIAIKKHFGIELERKEMRKYRRKDGGSMEVDVVGVGDGKVFVLEVKATPDREEYIDRFVEKLREFFDYFPEYRGLKMIPIYGSWNMKEETVKRLSELGIYAMIVRGDVLEIVNADDVKRKGA